MKRVLFATPHGGRTGSEMMLIYMIHKFAAKLDICVYTPKFSSFFQEELGSLPYFYQKTKGTFVQSIIDGVIFKLKKQTSEQIYFENTLKKIKPDLVYINTITQHHLARVCIKHKIPYLVHVHELVGSLDHEPAEGLDTMFRHATKIIACSGAVYDMLHKMGYKQTILKHSFIDVDTIKPKNREKIRQNLGLTSSDFVWACSGTLSMRKGFDLAHEIATLLPNNHLLIWLGGSRETGLKTYVMNQQTKNFLFLGEKSEDYYDYLNAADGFLLSSREDPFPLVMLEAAYLEKPIVGFESGGIKEFVKEKMGFVGQGIHTLELTAAMQKIAKKEIEIDTKKLKNEAEKHTIQYVLDSWLVVFE